MAPFFIPAYNQGMTSSLRVLPSTPFTPDALRRTLPPFGFHQHVPRDPLLQAYRSFYGLDFEQRMPGLKVHLGQVQVGGFDIAVQSFCPRHVRASVFVVHGYYDHVGVYNHLIEALLQRNFAVMIFDLPGHGLSSGQRATIFNFHQYQPVLQQVIRLADRHLPQPWHFVAQSTGGAIVSEYLLHHSGQPERLRFASAVLLAPLVRPVNWWFNRHVHTLISPFRDFIPRKFAQSSSDRAFTRFQRTADPLQPRFLSARWLGALKQWIPFLERQEPLRFPLLVIQGEQDETVDWRHNTALLRSKFLPADIFMIPAMRHQVVNEAQAFRSQVFARMNHFLLAHS